MQKGENRLEHYANHYQRIKHIPLPIDPNEKQFSLHPDSPHQFE
jgi:hypothetical protein